MPNQGDTVDVDITIQGVTAFQNKRGTVVSVSGSDVEVAVPLLNGVWQMKQMAGEFKQVSPGHWHTTAQLKLS
jgi:hypothetical protein